MKEVLSQIGLLRNPILIFGIMASFVMFYFGNDSLESDFTDSRIMGIVMMASGIVIVFLTLAFYLYALLRLPNSTFEKAFLHTLENTPTNHTPRDDHE